MSIAEARSEWLTVDEAAALLKVNPATIYRWCKQGEIAHTRVGRTYRVHRSALDGRSDDALAGERPLADARAAAAAAPRVIALVNQKGGVGKTTSCINLGAALAERGGRVLILDLDAQANATYGLTGQQDVTPSLMDVLLGSVPPASVVLPTRVPNLSLLPAAITLANVDAHFGSKVGREFILRPVIEALAPDYDIVLLDCPPSLGPLTVAALMAASEFVVPVKAHLFSVVGLDLLFDTVRTVRKLMGHADLNLLGILVNQGQQRRETGTPRGGAYGQVVEQLRARFEDRVFATSIPEAIAVEEAHQAATPVLAWHSGSQVADAYRRLAEEVLDHAR